MNDKLIEALLDCRVCFHDCACCDNNQEICCGSTDDLIDATVDAVELLTGQLAALQAQNAEKDKEIKRLEKEKSAAWEYQEQMVDAFAAMDNQALSRVEAERDAAKRDIESILRSCTCEVRHPFCARCAEPDGCDSDDCHDAEWRGAQGEA